MRELTLRLLSSGAGYVALVLMLRSPEPVRSYALYLPSSILVTLAFDLGRGETALQRGLSRKICARLPLELLVLLMLSIGVVVAFQLYSLTERVVAVLALGISGALQAYVDIFLRHTLFLHRRSLYLFLFQFAVSAVNVVIAAAVAFAIVRPSQGLIALVALPTMAVAILVMALGAWRSTDEATAAGATVRTATTALAYRAFPPAAYTAYAGALARLAPDYTAIARAFYFVFGFIHVRTMARESRQASVRQTTAVLVGLTILTGTPLLALGSPRPSFDWAFVGGCFVVTTCTAVVSALFLSRYRAFVNGTNSDSCSPEAPRSPFTSLTDSSRIVVHVPRGLGGVRNVTNSLADAFEHHGRTVVRAHGVWELLKARWNGHGDSAVLSLETGYLAFLFPNTVYILHGFPVIGAYSSFRRVAIRVAARSAKRGGARLVAVSHLTRAVHEKLFGIPIDAVIFNGCSQRLVDRAQTRLVPTAKRRRITYLGRLIDDKRLKTIVRGFLASTLPSKGYTLQIAGSGPLTEWVAGVARERPEVQVLGEITDETVKGELLAESEALISLNELEPMGIVFVEAILSGCKIVAPYCGGHREFIPPEHPVALCDHSDDQGVADAFDRVPSLPNAPSVHDASRFSYRDSIAPAYLRILDGASLAPADSKSDRKRSTAAA